MRVNTPAQHAVSAFTFEQNHRSRSAEYAHKYKAMATSAFTQAMMPILRPPTLAAAMPAIQVVNLRLTPPTAST